MYNFNFNVDQRTRGKKLNGTKTRKRRKKNFIGIKKNKIFYRGKRTNENEETNGY